jgi:hypothetical protein
LCWCCFPTTSVVACCLGYFKYFITRSRLSSRV